MRAPLGWRRIRTLFNTAMVAPSPSGVRPARLTQLCVRLARANRKHPHRVADAVDADASPAPSCAALLCPASTSTITAATVFAFLPGVAALAFDFALVCERSQFQLIRQNTESLTFIFRLFVHNTGDQIRLLSWVLCSLTTCPRKSRPGAEKMCIYKVISIRNTEMATFATLLLFVWVKMQITRFDIALFIFEKQGEIGNIYLYFTYVETWRKGENWFL